MIQSSNHPIHPTLAADTFPIGDLPLCRVLLMNNALFPWLILVPRVAEAVELTNLPEAEYAQAMQEIRQVAHALQELYKPYKLNIAALGNQVRQLHIHLIIRFEGDAAWPNPVWGGAREVYSAEAVGQRVRELQEHLSLPRHPE